MKAIILALGMIAGSAQASTYLALGDSITSGLNSEPWAIIQQYSWATGWDIDNPFAKTLGVDHYYNVALPAATTGMMGYQIKIAEVVKPDYVSLVGGANDICWNVDDHIFDNLLGYLRRLSAIENVKKIFIAGVPNLRRLNELRHEGLTCKLPKILCHGYFYGTDEKRQKADEKIVEVNNLLKRVSIELPKVVYVPHLSDTEYDAEDISTVDCFHPSKIGQQKIADGFSEAFLKE